MPPTIILVRHAQALHNVAHNLSQDYELPDPELSKLGREQCEQLRQNIREKLLKELEVGLIICSASRRTCETTMLGLGEFAAEKGIPIQAHAGWQENSWKPCDTGSPIATIAAEFPKIDFSRVDPVWPDKTSPASTKYWYVKDKLLARAQSCLRELYDRPEKAIIVVSHSAFIRQAMTGHFFHNADYRIYDFAEREEGSDKVALKQWDLTKDGHGGLGWSKDDVVELGVDFPEFPEHLEQALPPTKEEPLPAGAKTN